MSSVVHAGPGTSTEGTRPSRSPRNRLADVGWAGGVFAGFVCAGYLLADHGGTALLQDRMLPWILTRCLGIGAYLSLSALVAVGIWFRHPWRVSRRVPGPEALLRTHVALATATAVLLVGHIVAVCLDSFAGVGWTGAFVPWASSYRPTAVGVGTIALYGIVLVAGTAALAGSVARRIWLPIHSFSAVVFGLCAAHGLLAGSDSRDLWWMYAASAALVVALQVTRIFGRSAVLAETR